MVHFPACVEHALSPGPRELKIPTAREGAAATASWFPELLLALDDFVENLAGVLGGTAMISWPSSQHKEWLSLLEACRVGYYIRPLAKSSGRGGLGSVPAPPSSEPPQTHICISLAPGLLLGQREGLTTALLGCWEYP